ncbi:MAG: OmpA family protein [Saprospiraceae bacterium]|nr:OmpA family protein [Bacteroidia bacterium]NNF20629.1 OmpA family protein [Saprospiraceae bacterium]
MQRITILIFVLAISLGLQAQPIRDNTFDQKIEAAQLAESQDNFAGALDWYEKAYDEIRKGSRGNPLTKKFALKIAELNYKLRDYKKASSNYKRVLKNDDEFEYINERLIYAKSLKQEAKYDLALEVFNEFISLSEDEELIKEAEFEMEGIELIRVLDPNIETAVRALDKEVNSPSAEFSPRENADGTLYFASFDRKDEIEVDSEDDDFHARIFMASRNDKGGFEKKSELDQLVNRKGFHNTHLAFTRDGRTMYFTRVQTTGTEITASQILVSYNKDTGWSAANLAPTINGEWNAKHPAMGQLFGKDVMFFVSDMDGGLGGMDIYYSTLLGDGQFSAPVNLGPMINTDKDDITPFYYDGTLYFSTNGRPTIGGYDIFYSIWDGSEWSDAENIGMGYNSANDDMFMSLAADGSRGYFVSNRPSDKKKKLRSATCCDDIFQFNIREIVIDLLAIVVSEEEEPLNGSTIELENLSDPVNYPTDTKYNALGNEFQFLLDSDYKYKAIITNDGYYPDTIEFNTAGILDNYTVRKKVVLKKIPTTRIVTEIVTINEPIRLNNIYYEFDDDKILPAAEQDLNLLLELMDEYPDMVIELSSHTDSRGLTRYNEDLSQRRAESARNWLIENGVEEDRIEPVGYGESKILNKCTNGVRCSEEEHQLNRRTEFKIIAGPESIEIRREVQKTVIE